MLKIAITGNIASGKSQVEHILSKNFPVYDADKIAHQILDKITDFYGYDVFSNGKIDRKKLGKLVFANPDVKIKLEKLIHPKVKENIKILFDKHKNDELVFVSVPLLFESGFDNMFDKIIIVTTDEETRLARVISRDNLSKQEALARINSQSDESTKISKCDFLIENNSDLECLKKQVTNIIDKILS